MNLFTLLRQPLEILDDLHDKSIKQIENWHSKGQDYFFKLCFGKFQIYFSFYFMLLSSIAFVFMSNSFKLIRVSIFDSTPLTRPSC